jgi:prepilin-type N-terminal cleavage/methylation domain-containing protein
MCNNIDFKKEGNSGFSMVELLLALVITLIILGVAVASFTQALTLRANESSRTDALTSVQAAINLMSREISNSGYGLNTNGIILGPNDSNNDRVHFRANTTNTYPSNSDPGTINPGEDITFFYDDNSESIVRYDAVTKLRSGVINRISDVKFQYWDYSGNNVSGPYDLPTANTGRVEITLRVCLDLKSQIRCRNQPVEKTVSYRTQIALRNSPYMLGQY